MKRMMFGMKYEKQKIGNCILCNGDYIDVIKDIPDKKLT